jgi:hypothetical protein
MGLGTSMSSPRPRSLVPVFPDRLSPTAKRLLDRLAPIA